MRSFIISSALLVILVQCGYPVAENSYPTTPSYPTPPPSYPTPKKYPVAPTYPSPPAYAQKPSYSAPPPPAPSVYSSSSFSDNEVASDSEYTTASPNSECELEQQINHRKRAKARTAHNRKFQRRALTPIRRFQQKKQ